MPLLLLFVVALFLPAFLLGWLELLVGRMLLPRLGGTPAVWNSCLVFFQAAVLGGYALAHQLGRLKPRLQVGLYAVILGGSALALPLVSPADALATSPDGSPLVLAGRLLALLAVVTGPVAVVLCTSAPLFQRWFSRLGHPRSDDPYFLYAASNLGTLLGLIGHPLFIEPHLGAAAQARVWSGGYLVFAAVAVLAGLASLRRPASKVAAAVAGEAPTRRQQARWWVLAFLPCSLLHGVTTALTTDVAAVPLLWALPLVVYLAGFGAAFLPGAPPVPTWLERGTLVAMAVLGGLSLLNPPLPTAPLLLLHLATYAAVSWSMHRRLAAERPPPAHLTQFYLLVAWGGVAGGLFNAVAAPMLFDSTLEYPAMMLLAGVVIAGGGAGTAQPAASRSGRPLQFAVGLVGAILLAGVRFTGLVGRLPGTLLLAGLAWVCLRLFAWRRAHVVVGGVLLLLVSQFSLVSMGVPLRAERSFFAVHRVVRDERAGWVGYLHGTTLHGRQWLDAARRDEPLTYFHRTGPIGALFAALASEARPSRVGVLGLGIGTLAAYAQKGQAWTFFEIDPVVDRIARTDGVFSFLGDAAGAVHVELGDGRLLLAQHRPGDFDLLVMDAFSSDAVPVHLLTREAFALYASRLTPDGTLALNVTNRFLDLEPAVVAAAREQGFDGLLGVERDVPPGLAGHGKTSSRWIVLRRGSLPSSLVADARFRAVRAPAAGPWTDDHADVLSAVRLTGP